MRWRKLLERPVTAQREEEERDVRQNRLKGTAPLEERVHEMGRNKCRSCKNCYYTVSHQ